MKKLKLTSIFYAPNMEAVMQITKQLREEYERSDDHFTYELQDPQKLVNAIIETQYLNYVIECNSNDYSWKPGTMSLTNMVKVATECIHMYEAKDFFRNPGFYFNETEKSEILKPINRIQCTSKDESLIAVGRLADDRTSSDSDCYETAGGYRSYLAKKETPVEIHIDPNNRIYMTYKSSCLVDHYNNNFFGNSTGGGHSEYEYGQNESFRTHYFTGLRMDGILKSGIVRIEKMDFEKAEGICHANIDKK